MKFVLFVSIFFPNSNGAFCVRAKTLSNDLNRIDPGGTPYDGLYGEAPPGRGIFFRLQVYERVGISLVEVSKRVGKSVIWVYERAQKGQQMNYMAFLSRENVLFV